MIPHVPLSLLLCLSFSPVCRCVGAARTVPARLKPRGARQLSAPLRSSPLIYDFIFYFFGCAFVVGFSSAKTWMLFGSRGALLFPGCPNLEPDTWKFVLPCGGSSPPEETRAGRAFFYS